ncbi:hypothetical protein PoB_001833400 [Plakobranchus ocellatus]|uniref:Uncharacterized protein n=1 Tax=Plakobranchus ocellatus TaxID=259542 RepID=A0AAV3Z929_9GAST|nr:hypothetical protein PoB_001833400 [Plakobranchus ocellatus]
MTYNPIMELAGRALLVLSRIRGRRLLASRSCSSPNQVSFQRPVINKEKARGTSWAVIRVSIVLSYSSDNKEGDARTPILLLSRPIVTVQRIPMKWPCETGGCRWSLSDAEKEEEKVHAEIEKANGYKKCQDIMIIMEDCNAKIGDERVEDVVGPSGIDLMRKSLRPETPAKQFGSTSEIYEILDTLRSVVTDASSMVEDEDL